MTELEEMLAKLSIPDQRNVAEGRVPELAPVLGDALAYLSESGKKEVIRMAAYENPAYPVATLVRRATDELAAMDDDKFLYSPPLALGALAKNRPDEFCDLVRAEMGRPLRAARMCGWFQTNRFAEPCPQFVRLYMEGSDEFRAEARHFYQRGSRELYREAIERNDIDGLLFFMSNAYRFNDAFDADIFGELVRHGDPRVRARCFSIAADEWNGYSGAQTPADEILAAVDVGLADPDVSVRAAAATAAARVAVNRIDSHDLFAGLRERLLAAAKKPELVPFLLPLTGEWRAGYPADAEARRVLLTEAGPHPSGFVVGYDGYMRGAKAEETEGKRVCDVVAREMGRSSQRGYIQNGMQEICGLLDGRAAVEFVSGMWECRRSGSYDRLSARIVPVLAFLAESDDPEKRLVAAKQFLAAGMTSPDSVRSYVFGVPSRRRGADITTLPDDMAAVLAKLEADPDARVREAVAPHAAKLGRIVRGRAPVAGRAPRTPMEMLKARADALAASRKDNIREM